jgi:hypothetical protein
MQNDSCCIDRQWRSTGLTKQDGLSFHPLIYETPLTYLKNNLEFVLNTFVDRSVPATCSLLICPVLIRPSSLGTFRVYAIQMASFGRLTAALLGVSQENTFALANINFDFAIVKFEAPAEYKGLGESLSKRRKTAAEDGALHKVARKLGALFETEIPDVPHLIKAYGTRASEIAKLPKVNSSEAAAYGAFADYVGADGTTIWASATSGKNFVTIHLLACMLARIWTRQEAISIWSELVEERKEVLSNKTLDSSFRIADAVASRIELNRNELADWDASARLVLFFCYSH